MIKTKYICLFIIYFLSFDLWAQKTPKELGTLVFNAFKNKDYLTLDTLTPDSSVIVNILKQKYPSETFTKDSSFTRKYMYHDKQFKDKCKQFTADTIHFKVNWKNVTIEKIEFYEKDLKPKSDTVSKSFFVNYLEIYLTSNKDTFLIQFKNIYKYKDIWKLGENVRFQNLTTK